MTCRHSASRRDYDTALGLDVLRSEVNFAAARGKLRVVEVHEPEELRSVVPPVAHYRRSSILATNNRG